MKRNQKGFGLLEIIMVLAAVSVLVGIGFYFWKSYSQTKTPSSLSSPSPSGSNNPEPGSAYATISGKVSSMNLQPLSYDGDGIYEVKSDDGKKYRVLLTSGESNCAIYMSNAPEAVDDNINTGSRVRVHGKSDENNILRICDAGTYIKLSE